MKKYISISIFGLALLNCTNINAQAKSNPQQDLLFENYKNLDNVSFKKGKTLYLKINENPSTGYSWSLTPQKNCSVNIAKDTYKQNDSAEGMTGVPGVRTIEILGKKTGKCKITFKNIAPGGSVEETKSILFTVRK